MAAEGPQHGFSLDWPRQAAAGQLQWQGFGVLSQMFNALRRPTAEEGRGASSVEDQEEG